MRIKVDEDLPVAVAESLRNAGHDVLTVLDQAMSGWKDQALWVAVQQEKRFLVTADKGFADIRRYSPGSHAGILLLRPDDDGIAPLLALLDAVLATYPLEALDRSITVASPRGVRIRRSA